MKRREDIKGKHGFHPRLQDFVQLIGEQKHGATKEQLLNQFDASQTLIEQLLLQAEALGMIEVEDRGHLRVFYTTEHQHLDIDDYRNDNIVSEIRKALNKLQLGPQDAVRVTLQKVEGGSR